MSVAKISVLALYLALSDAAPTDPSRDQPRNKVTIYNSTYATLDDVWENLPKDDFRSNKFYAKLPVGWSVAEDTSDARIAIQLYNFGSEYVVLDKIALNHNLEITPGQAVIDEIHGIKSNVAKSSRILIKKDEPAPTEKKPFLTVPITNLITFKGRDYAMVDNSAPTDEAIGGCDPFFYVLTDGWEVAADNQDTHAVMITARFPFKYICKVTASGQGYGYGLKSSACKSDMLVDIHVDKKEVISVNGMMCGGVIVSRKSKLADTWTQETEITNVYKVTKDNREHQYAVLDNTPADQAYLANTPEGKCDNCCQNVAMKIPMGWELAKKTMPGYIEAASQPWGTYCTGGMTFDGKPCQDYIEDSVTSISEYATTRFCDSRTLIKRTPIDCVSSWSEWSACSDECASVKTRERTKITQQAQFGGMCEMTEKTNSGCSNTCAISTSTSTSASASASATPARGGVGATVPSVLASVVVFANAFLF